MRRILGENGVDTFSRSRVDQIIVENGQAKGVRVGDRVIGADVVLSNASIHGTALGLVGEEHFAEDWVEGLKKVRLNTSSCQVYMGLKEGESLPWVSDLFFTSTRPTFDSAALCDLHGESRTFSFYYPKGRPEDQAAGKPDRYVIVSSTNALFEDWERMSPEEYEANKQRMVDETIADIERRVPGTARRSSTPRPRRRSRSASTRSPPTARPSGPSSRACRTRWASPSRSRASTTRDPSGSS